MNTLFTVLLLLTAMPLCAMKKVKFSIPESKNPTIESTPRNSLDSSSNTSSNRLNTIVNKEHECIKAYMNEARNVLQFYKNDYHTLCEIQNTNDQITTAILAVQEEKIKKLEKAIAKTEAFRSRFNKKPLENTLIKRIFRAVESTNNVECNELKMDLLSLNNSSLLEKAITLLEKICKKLMVYNDDIKSKQKQYDDLEQKIRQNSFLDLKTKDKALKQRTKLGCFLVHLESKKETLSSRYKGLKERLEDLVNGNYDEDYHLLDECYFD